MSLEIIEFLVGVVIGFVIGYPIFLWLFNR